MSSPCPGANRRPGASRRLFFALWPEGELAERIDKVSRHAMGKADKRIPPAKLHITLVFLGAASAEREICIRKVAAAIRGQPFKLSLDCIDCWPRPKILWLGPSEMPDALSDLVRQMNQGLAGCGFVPEPRPYRAHMTLARKVSGEHAGFAIDALEWSVTAFCLVESITYPDGARYEVLERFPLG